MVQQWWDMNTLLLAFSSFAVYEFGGKGVQQADRGPSLGVTWVLSFDETPWPLSEELAAV